MLLARGPSLPREPPAGDGGEGAEYRRAASTDGARTVLHLEGNCGRPSGRAHGRTNEREGIT